MLRLRTARPRSQLRRNERTPPCERHSNIKNIEGVKSASISFMTQKLVLEADDDRFEAVLDEAQRACKKFEPDCVILR